MPSYRHGIGNAGIGKLDDIASVKSGLPHRESTEDTIQKYLCYQEQRQGYQEQRQSYQEQRQSDK